VGDPVEGPSQREGRHFRVARLDRAVLDTLADQAADPLVDLGLERFDVAAHGRRQVLVLGPHHAPAEFGGDRLAVVTQHGIQPLARRYRQLAHGAERGTDLLDARHEALEQQLFLAGDVVVHRGLGDFEPGGDLIEGGVVVALAVELACCGADHCIALELAITQPLAVAPPRVSPRTTGCYDGCSWRREYYSGAAGGRLRAQPALPGAGAALTITQGAHHTGEYSIPTRE